MAAAETTAQAHMSEMTAVQAKAALEEILSELMPMICHFQEKVDQAYTLHTLREAEAFRNKPQQLTRAVAAACDILGLDAANQKLCGGKERTETLIESIKNFKLGGSPMSQATRDAVSSFIETYPCKLAADIDRQDRCNNLTQSFTAFVHTAVVCADKEPKLTELKHVIANAQ